MPIYLSGVSARNYRGIGSIAQRAAPFRTCNFFIGTNNSGKSNFLNLISSHLLSVSHGSRRDSRLSLSQLEIHLGATINEVEIGVAIPLSEAVNQASTLLQKTQSPTPDYLVENLESVLRSLAKEDLVWISMPAANLAVLEFADFSIDKLKKTLSEDEWKALWRRITDRTGGGLTEHWIPEVINRLLTSLRPAYPEAKLIPAKRQIGKKGENFGDFSGVGLIDKLAELQNPGPTNRHLTKIFEKINDFLRDVTGDKTALIEIPHDREEVLVHKENRVLPLSSLGTGIHEVVMIAAFCTLTENRIVCIEEPEIHLHPLLQKKLIRYIVNNTSNQYFIATHSASIIDQPGAALFHVTQHDGQTLVEAAVVPNQRFRACQDLGYRASDLIQTNSIIWVEGPSDRIYLNHWIKSVDPALQEGLHYSLMYYGGRLLSHLSAEDEEVDEFIALRNLNRNMAIVIDSDKNSSHGKINETKKRVIAEFTKHGDPAWLTAGREIENYISEEAIAKALASIYPQFLQLNSTDRYSHRLHFIQRGKNSTVKTEVDKVKVARLVCNNPPDLDVLNLRTEIDRIVSMIRQANS